MTDFEYGDYDVESDVTPVPAYDAGPYQDVTKQDVGPTDSFVNVEGVSPAQAIATARAWSKARKFVGVGECLATVRQYYAVPPKYLTAADSWQAAEHKHFAKSGIEVPRGAPVWWTGGSSGAGHVAISVGGGLCLSTDWKEPGKIDYARIDDITATWALNFKGWTRELNDVVVWRPAPAGPVVHLSNLLPGRRNDDVLALKKRLSEKGYKGFIVKSSKFGRGLKAAYAAYQRRLGYFGPNANGVPGKLSLEKLGFTVKP